MLTNFANRIWTCTTALNVYGLELGSRMTIVDLDGQGSLLVHSAIKLHPELKKQIDALGVVKYVIAPNKWHHLFIGDFKAAYPEAKFYCAPGLQKKRADFQFDGIIGEEQNYPWNPFVEHKFVAGVPLFNEVVFFHHLSKTLILTDLAIHICESKSWLTRSLLKLLGSYGKFGWARLEKKIYVKDHSAFKASLENILLWDIEKIALTHGTPIEGGGKERLREAFF